MLRADTTRANGPSRKLGAVTGRPKIRDICQTRLVSCNQAPDKLTSLEIYPDNGFDIQHHIIITYIDSY